MKNLQKICILFSIVLSINTFAGDDKIGASLHKKEKIEVKDIPEGVLTAIKLIAPDMIISEAEKEYKNGNIYIDVEGKLSDGRDIEFDLLKNKEDWQVVEIQRDLMWDQLPEIVISALQENSPEFSPKRIIESIQYGEDITIYEFYSINNDGKEFRKEVKVEGNKAEVLTKEWMH